jgi:hypothetical protein
LLVLGALGLLQRPAPAPGDAVDDRRHDSYRDSVHEDQEDQVRKAGPLRCGPARRADGRGGCGSGGRR